MRALFNFTTYTVPRLLHTLRIVRYSNFRYIVSPEELDQQYVKIEITRTVLGLFSKTLSAYRRKPRHILESARGFSWTHNGKLTPGLVLEHIEEDLQHQQAHQRALLDMELGRPTAPTPEAEPH